MAKINIYVPDELEARMDRAGKRNWSAAAQRAFELECHLVEVLMDTEDSTIARLRASKAEWEATTEAAGRKAGQAWARDDADYDQLKRLATFDVDALNDDDRADRLGALLDCSEPGQWSAEVWENLTGSQEQPEWPWINGFIEGATEVWDEVADKV
jgi:hypothetical protein